ncbi:MAG: endonuclease/exonuclease/phosphatase family protein [Rhodothermaceae bacterium]|nr:endonuclease/exonuclease/phosphatase family protein [Rhodothermaceae bacterium]
MSFNILYATAQPKNWETGRRDLVVKTINQVDADIIGLQEVMKIQKDQLESDLEETYTLVTPWNNSYFGNSIGYKNNRFTEIDRGRFTFSPTPDVPGTDFHNNDNSRYASWIILKDNKTNKSIFVLSTHFYSHREQKVERHKSAQILMDKILKLSKGLPVIAMGDFNTVENSAAYVTITEHKINPLTDTYRVLHPNNPDIDGTVNGGVSRYPGLTNGERIDYIFSSQLRVLESGILHTHFNENYPSDHFPVTARFGY